MPGGFTDEELEEQLTAVKVSLKSGSTEVAFPDGSRVRYASLKELREYYDWLIGLQGSADPTAPPSSFVVRGGKGLE